MGTSQGRGVAQPSILTSIVVVRPSILTSIVVAAEWPNPALSLLSSWPRSGGPAQHSHFYRNGRQVLRFGKITLTLGGGDGFWLAGWK